MMASTGEGVDGAVKQLEALKTRYDALVGDKKPQFMPGTGYDMTFTKGETHEYKALPKSVRTAAVLEQIKPRVLPLKTFTVVGVSRANAWLLRYSDCHMHMLSQCL